MKKQKKTKAQFSEAFVNKILEYFNKNPFSLYNYKQLSYTLGINDRAGKVLVRSVLSQLCSDKVLIENKTGQYKLHPDKLNENLIMKSNITGLVEMKQTGKAYIITDEPGEDIYISAANTYHALDGDYVKVFLFPKRRSRKPEGRITEIITRKKKQYVGTLEVSKNFAFLIPDSKSMPVDIFISKNGLKGGKNGQKAIAKITEWPDQSKNPFGEIIEVLGNPGDNNVEMISILADNDLPLAFPKNVENEAKKIDTSISKEEIKRRSDFRDTLTITIDPFDAKDFDDAISFKQVNENLFEIGVHIADVSHYVQANTVIDKEAFDRATSVYLVDRVIPMLPESLSNFVCSLRPNEEKLCFSIIFKMDIDGNLSDHRIEKTIIKSDRRFNYDEVQEIIESGKGDFSSEINILNTIAKKLRKQRFEKGAINFESKDVRFVLDENSKPVSIYLKESKESNNLIEEFMLLANRKVAENIGKNRGRTKPKTFVYRIHDIPSPEKLNTFAQFLSKLGYKMKTNNQKQIAESFNKLFEAIEGKGEKNMIETIAIRTMAKAEYSTENIGHYGLSFPYYTHFTSPIRRYPDLIVHRLLFHYLNKGSSLNKAEIEDICEHSSEMERKAVAAERDSIKYKQAEYLLDKIGQKFEGLISGVSKWGIYVELIGNSCEGMISLRDLDDDFYYLDEDNYQVIGQRYGEQYKLGDKLTIRVKRIDLSKKQMDFELVD